MRNRRRARSSRIYSISEPRLLDKHQSMPYRKLLRSCVVAWRMKKHRRCSLILISISGALAHWLLTLFFLFSLYFLVLDNFDRCANPLDWIGSDQIVAVPLELSRSVRHIPKCTRLASCPSASPVCSLDVPVADRYPHLYVDGGPVLFCTSDIAPGQPVAPQPGLPEHDRITYRVCLVFAREWLDWLADPFQHHTWCRHGSDWRRLWSLCLSARRRPFDRRQRLCSP
jgi:hypothetical protein